MLDISTLESEDCSPPQPFLQKAALENLWARLNEKGVLCINTIIKGKEEKAIRQKFMKDVKALGTCFTTKCQESSNEIVFVCRSGPSDRSKQLSNNIQSMKMQGSNWMSKKVMKIMSHVEGMQQVK